MNWLFTRPGATARFESGEPILNLYPIRRELEAIEPEVRSLADEPELQRQYDAWTASRNQFNASLKEPDGAARAQKWQKNYHRGQDAFGQTAGGEGHRTRLRLRPFARAGEGGDGAV